MAKGTRRKREKREARAGTMQVDGGETQQPHALNTTAFTSSYADADASDAPAGGQPVPMEEEHAKEHAAAAAEPAGARKQSLPRGTKSRQQQLRRKKLISKGARGPQWVHEWTPRLSQEP